MPTLLYIGQNPAAGTGTPIIVLRHLRRFTQAGWNVRVLAEYGGDYRECQAAGWSVQQLPRRRWWWPPYRDRMSSLRWMRLRLLARHAVAAGPRPDVILSYLAPHTDFSPRLAVHAARLAGAPLHMLVHDDATAFPGARGRERAVHANHAAILRQTDVCWFVSPELAECFPEVRDRARLLYPIPEGWSQPAVWRDELRQQRQIFYAGAVWPEQVPLMARIAAQARAGGAGLTVIAKPSPALQTLGERDGAAWLPPFPTNTEALQYLVDHAAALLVSYADTVAAMPWSASSFPSKLVEYCHLGIPILVVAPPDSAVARWAERIGFSHCFDPAHLEALPAWVAALGDRSTWEQRAAGTRQLARGEFDPERIQAVLANAFLAGTETRPT